MSENLRNSPLHAVHEAAGASFTDFGGWQMPLRYTSDLAEHHAVPGIGSGAPALMIQAVAQAGDFDLHLTAVPPNFPLRYERPFEPRYMRTLFATGEAAGLSGRAWGTMAELTGVGE